MAIWAFPTPQAGALKVVGFGLKKPATIVRINVVGRYAAVLTRGGVMESWHVTAPVLLERFSFGWQPLDVLNFRCRLDLHELGSGVSRLLMQDMPEPSDDRPCRGIGADAGAPADVVAVRKLMRGPLVPYVVVVGNWAMGGWYGAGGGESLYQRLGHTWRIVVSVGGAMGVDEMRRYGVPNAAWCKFGIYNATCR